MRESGPCVHGNQPHTVMYWLEDGGPPIPMTARFDTQQEAIKFAESGVAQNNPILKWIKIFRSDNESYTCWRWENPMVEIDNTVKLEVDMEPLKVAFDNVAIGFKNQGRSIQRLWLCQGLSAVGLIATNVLVYVLR